jgi:hypothetical protein
LQSLVKQRGRHGRCLQILAYIDGGNVTIIMQSEYMVVAVLRLRCICEASIDRMSPANIVFQQDGTVNQSRQHADLVHPQLSNVVGPNVGQYSLCSMGSGRVLRGQPF